MNHPLRQSEVSAARPLNRLYAAVSVKRANIDSFFLEPIDGDTAIMLADAGTMFAPLPKRFVVCGWYDGPPLKPSQQFWITVNTIDPYHAILDAGPEVFR